MQPIRINVILISVEYRFLNPTWSSISGFSTELNGNRFHKPFPLMSRFKLLKSFKIDFLVD